MIPRHSPSFGLAALVKVLAARPAVSVAELERAYRDALGVAEVVLLPSVRTGVYLTLKAVLREEDGAVCPAYVCQVLQQAVVMSGARVEYLDSSADAFVPTMSDLTAAAAANKALVVAEIYGIPYEASDWAAIVALPARVRILDLAMSFPDPQRMKQLQSGDVAFLSFGFGKPMYAGAGGVACFADANLAGAVREGRTNWMSGTSLKQTVRHAASLLGRVASHHRLAYPLARRAASWRHAQPAALNGTLDHQTDEFDQSSAWKEPMTAWERKMALYVLENYQERQAVRRRQAETYLARLAPMGLVPAVTLASLPQSHFPICVDRALRGHVRDWLAARGIDTDVPSPLPSWVSGPLPHARDLCERALMLPLSERLSIEEADSIARSVLDALAAAPVAASVN